MQVKDDKNFDLETKNGVSVVKFVSLWNSDSRILEESFNALSAQYRGRAKFISSDINANPKLAEKEAVIKVPMVIIYLNGKQVARLTDVSKRHLREKIEHFLAKEELLKGI